jgi:hypothetical protein
VSGDSQEATPDPTKPASALLPLALPLQVGVANGEWPIAGARVRFRLQPGTGDGTLDPADGIVFTDGDGIASCRWSIDSTSANQEIVAELLDDADARVHLPIRFHARLNTAALVAYNPATCEGMKGAATAVITVQDAIDFLCRDRASTDCCVTIGGIGDRPGDYGTVAEAIKDLLQKRRHASICLSLLPGDHPIEELLVTPGEGATLTHVRITGCSQASRLLVRGPLRFQNLAEVVIRDLSMRSETAEAPVVMYERCREVEINNCRLQGRAPAMALISVAEVQRFRLISSLINAAGKAGDSDPSKVFKTAIPLLAKVFQQLEDRDFDAESALAADALAKLSPRERGTMAKSLNEAVENAKANLTDDELAAYTDFVKALRRNDPPPQGLFQQLSAIRAADAAATTPAGEALTLLDVAADSVLVDNRIKGIISLGGPPAGKALNQDERQKLADLIKRGAVEITASSGKLQLRGNHLMQIAVGDRMLEALRNLINQGNGSLPVWGSAHYSDNVIELGDNVFLARHLSLNTTRFLETATDLGTAVSHSGVFLGNSADQDVRLFCLGISALAANQGLNIVQL